MKKASAIIVAVVLASLPGIGCSDPKAREIALLRNELEAAKAESARAHAEAEAARAELVRALAEAHIAKTELARLKGEPAPALPTPRTTDPSAEPLEKRFASLKANYDKGAIQSNEWTQLKTKVIEGIPLEVPVSDRRTLGERLIALRGAYEAGAIQSNEWTQAKAKLIVQRPAAGRPAAALDRELDDLKKAYDAGAMQSNEWTQAKAEVIKWAK